VTPTDTTVVEKDDVLKSVRELRSELAAAVTQNKLDQSTGWLGDLQSQLTKFEEEQKAAKQQLEAQTDAMMQLQQQMKTIEQLCMKLDQDLNALSAKQ